MIRHARGSLPGTRPRGVAHDMEFNTFDLSIVLVSDGTTACEPAPR